MVRPPCAHCSGPGQVQSRRKLFARWGRSSQAGWVVLQELHAVISLARGGEVFEIYLGAVPLGPHFAKESGRTEAPRRRKAAAVGVSDGKVPGVRRHRHLAGPSERAQGIVGRRHNLAWRSHLGIGDRKGESGGHGAATEKEKLVSDRHILHMDGQSIVCNVHGVVGDLQNPKNAIRRDAGIKLMEL